MSSILKVCGSFALYCCCDHGFLYKLNSSTVRWGKRWRKRFLSSEDRWNYIAAEWQKILFVTLWVLINIGLFTEAAVRWLYRAHKTVDDALILNPVLYKGYRQAEAWVFIARGFGQLLNFNCAMIMLPVMRTVLNVLRSLKFGVILPLDKNVIFHRYIAYWIAICTAGHAMAHYMNYSCCHLVYKTSRGNPERSSWTAAWGNKFGLTGHLITIIMVLMYGSGTASYRRSNNFTVFWYTHHLFVLFFTLLLIHARNFWMWFLGPGALYIVERFLRNVRGSSITIVKKVTALPSMVVHLELEKPAFRYEAGQYCFVNCPLISRHEWHPFTISSAPEEEHLTFHIRCVGDWTGALKDLFVPTGKGTVVINKPTTPTGDSYLIRVDGPFGTAAEYVYNFEYVILVAAGIGVTPYASLLKHMRYQIRTGHAHFKIKRVFFYWINRDSGSWEWFSDMLDDLEDTNPEFFEIHTHMTGALKADEVRRIIDTSSEYMQTGRENLSSGKLLARANYDYEPQASDEIGLKRGDEVEVEEKDDSGWWKGTNKTTKANGLFPSNYVSFVDSVTKMRTGKNRRFGRPDWHEEFGEIRKFVEQNTPDIKTRVIRPSVGIFICGPSVLSKQLYQTCNAESKNSSVQFKFHKENF